MKPIPYSAEQLDFIKDNCTLDRNTLHRLFCQTFNRSDVSVINLNAVRKRHGWLTGRSGCFKKGHDGYKGGPKGPNSTSFKKGAAAINALPMFSERIKKDGYVWIKVPERNPYTGAPTRFVQKHHWLWRQAGRELPKNHVLAFRDGDRENCTLDNLELWSRADLGSVNKLYGHLSPELRPTARELVNIKRSVRSKKKRKSSHG